MKWFETYHSNTIAAGGNQSIFTLQENEIRRGRVYYKIFAGGEFRYSLLFSNIIDSTFADGSVSHCNLVCDEWEIVEAAVGICDTCGEFHAGEPDSMLPLFFQGQRNKTVMPGEFFTSDPISLNIRKDQYLCLELSFRGQMIPCHEETRLPVFIQENGHWIPSKEMPLPGMIGCDRKVRGRIGFLGDSITQGIGTPVNSYAHWNALAAEALGEEYSFWNLGLGFGRAQDAASDGAWLFKAKQTDAVVLCYGVNDLLQGRSGEQIEEDLLAIIHTLRKNYVRVLLQTIPPFDLSGAELATWLRLNGRIRSTLSREADGIFDVVPALIEGGESQGRARYGGHPNEDGCAAWARALIPVMKEFLNL